MLTTGKPRLRSKDVSDARKLIEKLKHFNVTGSIERVTEGPALTTYFLKLDRDVRYANVVRLSEDLAMELSVASVRVGRSLDLVRLEVAKKEREMVSLSELLTPELTDGLELPIAIGKLSDGTPKVVDLTELPHLLIAGTTGSGKSVALHSMIVSLLCRKTEEQVNMILIDPKRVELGVYRGLPHLLGEVITNADDAVRVLEKVTEEIDFRYGMMEAEEARSITTYREKSNVPLPYLVVFVDEFSDLMMVSNKKVEDSVVRIAQVGRAAGVHLVLSTQRPTVNVVTGLIKANIQSRLCFQVAQKIDSRVMLDENGAEKLLGKGDGLFRSPGDPELRRIHGAFITEGAVQILVGKAEAKLYGEVEV